MKKDGFFEKNKKEIKEWLQAIVVAFVLATVVRTFVIQPFRIPSSSMEPTLRPGDMILVNKFIYGIRIPFVGKRIFAWHKPQRGEVIVFLYTRDRPSKYYIKRLAGLPGEKVLIKDGYLYVNDKAITETPFNKIYYYNKGEFGQEERPIFVPLQHYFMLGDNSAVSSDSRVWGFVADRYLMGKAILIFWPLHRIRLIK